MDSFDDDDPFHPSPLSLSPTTKKEEDEKVEEEENVENLLDEAWFYGKVLAKPPGMSRCYSDPGQRLLPDNPKNLDEEKETRGRKSKIISKLNRQLSDLSLAQKKEQAGFVPNIKGSSFPKHKLLRTPSLPSPCIVGQEEEAEDESEITMSRLIREAILPLSSQLLPPRSLSSKGMTQGSSIQKNRPAKNLKDLGYPPNQRRLKKSLSVVESSCQELKELGLTNHQRRGVSPEEYLDKVKRRIYIPKTWAPLPLIPIWANKNSAEDMKLQIKYWARAVASKARS